MSINLSEIQQCAWIELRVRGALDDRSLYNLNTMRALERKGLINLHVWPAYASLYGRCIGRGWSATPKEEQ